MVAWCVEPHARAVGENYARHVAGAYFGEWAREALARLAPSRGERVLDLACGAGSVALEAARRVGRRGRVVGVDISRPMLEIASREASPVAWVQGDAHRISLRSASFDAACCPHGLMFFDDPSAALGEIARVVAPGGRVVATTWAEAASNPHEAAFALALRGRVVGEDAFFSSLFGLSDPDELGRLAEAAGLSARVVRRRREARFQDADAYWTAMAWARPLAAPLASLPRRALARIRNDALARLEPYRRGEEIVAPMEALVLEARRA